MLQTTNKQDVDKQLQRILTLLLVVYVYDATADTFRPLPDMPRDLPMQIHNARQALQLIDTGKQSAGA